MLMRHVHRFVSISIVQFNKSVQQAFAQQSDAFLDSFGSFDDN